MGIRTKISQVINVFLIICAIVGNIYAFIKGGALISDLVSIVTTIFALACTLVYTIRGYRQEDAKLFSAFIFFIIVTLLLQIGGEVYYLIIIGLSIIKSSFISIFSLVLDTILLVILALVKDIEKKAALTFAGTMVIFSIFNFFRTIAMYGNSPSYLALTFSAIVLSLIVLISVYERYKYNENKKSENDDY